MIGANICQAYAFLKAFEEPETEEYDCRNHLSVMAKISKERFGSDKYVFRPMPLKALFKHSHLVGDIRSTGAGTWELTEDGRHNLRLAEKQVMNSYFESKEPA